MLGGEAVSWRCDPCDREFASARGLASHNGRVHTKAKPQSTSCPVCGVVVADAALHAQWHVGLAATARQAHHADVMTRPIGGCTTIELPEVGDTAWIIRGEG